MKFILALINLSAHLFAPFVIILPLLWVKYFAEDKTRLPKCFSWFDTPDQLLPGDIEGEPAVKKWLDDHGWFYCAWRWLGTRNVFFGFSWQFGKPAINYMNVMTPEEQKACEVYENKYYFWKIKFLVGYAVYFDCNSWYTKNGFWAVPRFTIRPANQD